MSRPTGVTILTILIILWGIFALIYGFIAFGSAGPVASLHSDLCHFFEFGLIDLEATGFALIHTISRYPITLSFAVAITAMVEGFLYLGGGLVLLSLKNWARWIVILINIAGLIGGIVLTVIIIGAIIGIPMIIISIIIIWYLWRKETRTYFT
ncbi:MAG: hypothetical protein ACETWM_09965 [Candidatus Lokiarchaeia archaeon]